MLVVFLVFSFCFVTFDFFACLPLFIIAASQKHSQYAVQNSLNMMFWFNVARYRASQRTSHERKNNLSLNNVQILWLTLKFVQ